uniref:Uncharacterized protein n=1 Tax=Glossina palpalis gambiensis TaxID=67801 RepID=A0A1B0BH71_9MUSC
RNNRNFKLCEQEQELYKLCEQEQELETNCKGRRMHSRIECLCCIILQSTYTTVFSTDNSPTDIENISIPIFPLTHNVITVSKIQTNFVILIIIIIIMGGIGIRGKNICRL